MAQKISLEELTQILKKIADKNDYDDMQAMIYNIADEYGIDLSDVDEDDELEFYDEEDITSFENYDEEEDEYGY